MVSSTMTGTGESDKEIKSMAFTPCSFLLLFRKYFFMTTSVNGNLKMTDLRFSNSITGKAYADAGITSVLGCAKQYSPYGISYIITGETSTDLPDTTYKYGMGIILKRADDQITILLFSNTGNKIAVNNYYGTKWSGWIPLLS